MGVIDNGLDLLNLDETRSEEIDSFRKAVASEEGGLEFPLQAYHLWLEERPDVLKMHRRQVNQLQAILPPDPTPPPPMVNLANLHNYTIWRFGEGILHQLHICQQRGVSKAQVLEILAVAWIHSGPSGQRFIYSSSFDFLRRYQDLPTAVKFPERWAPDPAAFKSGLDRSTMDLSSVEKGRLLEWYRKTLGEVPRSVEFLAKNNPGMLKAYRIRWENSIRDGLPKQVMPYLMLQFNVGRGFRDGIREAALLGKAWGMSKPWLIHAVMNGLMHHAGIDSMYIAEDAVADILNSMA